VRSQDGERLLLEVVKLGAFAGMHMQRCNDDEGHPNIVSLQKRPEPWDERFDSVLPSLAPGPEAAFEQAVLLEELEAAIGELTPGQLEVFVAHEVEGHSFAKIAERTGVKVTTLLSRKHAAVQRLRRQLGHCRD